MAVGDVVNGINAGTSITFQPAVGVEYCITSICGGNGNYAYIKMTDGTNTATTRASFTTYWAFNSANIKVMINNTNYCEIASGGGAVAFSGIQTK